MTQMKIEALVGSKQLNGMMRHFDAADRGSKLFCASVKLTAMLDGTRSADVVFAGIVASMCQEYDVAFVRSSSHSFRWRNEAMKTVSNGKQFFVLDELDK